MRDVLEELHHRWSAGETVGMATVVGAYLSAPRAVGAAMVVSAAGTVTGSISGGCVEGAVYELAQRVINDGIPVLERYGVSDDDAFAAGLSCGGTIEVFVERITPADFPALDDFVSSVAGDRPVATATVIAHPDPARVGARLVVWPHDAAGSIGSARADAAIVDDARGLLAGGRSATLTYGPEGERLGDGMSVFVNVLEPPRRMLIFGATDFARAMARQGSFLGYRVTVCDARAVFTTAQRFPEADEVVVAWPHKYLEAEVEAGRVDDRTVVTVLTHDPKFDIPVLATALRAQLGYVGAMGSRRTHDDRIAQLRELGLDDRELAALASPIGLDLGARTPAETAVSIAAEIIAAQWGGSTQRLGTTLGRIHQ